jgi:tetratricopeptide (TPR) repeat protein
VPGEQEQYKQILEQAQQYNQRQNYKEAFDLVEQVLHMVPNDIAALTLKGQLLGTAGRLAEAMATVEQILQHDPNNALAWSMRAVLLSNMGQQHAALSAIERSLEIDTSNPESYGIKTHIMEMLASQQVQSDKRVAVATPGVSRKPVPPGASPAATKDNPRAFFMAAGVQVLGFILGVVGAASPYFLSQTVPYASLALASLGLAIMCVVATQGAFRYGFARVILTITFTILSAVILGGGYQVLGLPRILANIQAQTQVTVQAAVIRVLAFGFIGMWLAAAALLPFFGSVGGFVTGALRRRYIRGKNGL